MKDYLATPLVLQPDMQNKSFILYTVTSAHALATVLAQQDENGKEHPIYYISQTLIDYEKRYTMIEKQCLDLVLAISKLQHYLLNVEIHVITKFDHLKHLFARTYLSRRLAKWVMLLTKFDLKFVSQKDKP